MHCYTQCPQPCSRPLPTHASAGDSWTLPGKSGSVSCGVTAPFSWVLVHTRFSLCPPRVCFQVLCKFWRLYGRANGDLLQKVPCTHRCTQCPNPVAGHCQPTPPLETPGHSWESLGQSLVGSLLLSPGSWCT